MKKDKNEMLSLEQVLQFVNKDNKYLNRRFNLTMKEESREGKIGNFDRTIENLTTDMNTLKDGEMIELDIELEEVRDLVEYRLIEISKIFEPQIEKEVA